MARSNTITTMMGVVPALMFAAFTGAGFMGVTSLMGQVVTTEYGCKVTQFEKVEGSPEEFLIHTDACSNSKNTNGNVFRANVKQLESNLTAEKFWSGVKQGKTYDFTVQGMAVEPLHMTPTVVKVTENIFPY
jgi:hypothetical protein